MVANTNIRRRIFPKTLLAAAIVTACSFAAAPVGAASIGAAGQTKATQAKEFPYYVEFRVADDGVYGHSYIAYGRVNAAGEPATATYADIHPTGSIPSMVLGHLIPMAAATTPEKETLGFKIASRFRRLLTAAEYHRLTPSSPASAPRATPGASSPTIATTSSPTWRAASACRRRLRCCRVTTSSRSCRR